MGLHREERKGRPAWFRSLVLENSDGRSGLGVPFFSVAIRFRQWRRIYSYDRPPLRIIVMI